MPIYNEEEIIQEVIISWLTILRNIKINFVIKAYNDGSKDNSLLKLKGLSIIHTELQVINKPNTGHGPTILEGYRESSTRWIFQVDSDNEMVADHFKSLWQIRNDYDLVIGKRAHRVSPLSRRIVTLLSELTIKVFYGFGIADVNSPYRLYRKDKFIDVYQNIPIDTFAPNVLLSGYAVKKKLKFIEIPVPTKLRETGEVSIKKLKLILVALKSFIQTIRFRFSKTF
jgi:glycosyltransferase involved in cell wall biosynthesis